MQYLSELQDKTKFQIDTKLLHHTIPSRSHQRSMCHSKRKEKFHLKVMMNCDFSLLSWAVYTIIQITTVVTVVPLNNTTVWITSQLTTSWTERTQSVQSCHPLNMRLLWKVSVFFFFVAHITFHSFDVLRVHLQQKKTRNEKKKSESVSKFSVDIVHLYIKICF